MKYRLLYFVLAVCFVSSAQSPFARVRENLVIGEYKASLTLLDSCYNKDFHKDSSLFYSGLIWIKSGNDERCREYCNRLSKHYPAFFEVHYLKGLMYFFTENYGRSADEFTKVLIADPGNIKALFDRSVALGMLEDYLAAIEDLNTCVKTDPSFSKGYYSRAYWYEFTGNYTEAAKDYESAIRLDPKNFDAYFGLAYIYQVQKNTAKACETITRAIDQGSQIAEELKESFCRQPAH